MIKLLRHYLSLERIEYRFTDHIAGKEVWLYRDCYDEYWLKDGRWSFFRVPSVSSRIG